LDYLRGADEVGQKIQILEALIGRIDRADADSVLLDP